MTNRCRRYKLVSALILDFGSLAATLFLKHFTALEISECILKMNEKDYRIGG